MCRYRPFSPSTGSPVAGSPSVISRPAPSTSPFTFCALPSHSIFLSPLSFPPVSFSSPSALSPSSPTLHLPRFNADDAAVSKPDTSALRFCLYHEPPGGPSTEFTSIYESYVEAAHHAPLYSQGDFAVPIHAADRQDRKQENWRNLW